MNDNHIIVCGQQVAIGPMLAHMMLSSQALQDRLLGLADQAEEILDETYPIAETDGGAILLTLELFGGFPSLNVVYVDLTYTAMFEHVGGDSIETLEKTFDGEAEVIEWFSDVSEPSRTKSEKITLPFADRFGEYTRVELTDIKATPIGDGTWVTDGTVWTDHLDAGLQREAEAARKAA